MNRITKTSFLTFIMAILIGSFTANAQTKSIKADQSSVAWKGYKVTGSHNGTIIVKSGDLEFKDSALVGGTLVIDMTSINTTDLKGEMKANLDGHLKSDDFFGVANFPDAVLKITKATVKDKNTVAVVADVTIKGKTNQESFIMTVSKNKANASFKVNRTKYGVRYGSASFFDNLKDKAINDEFDLNIELTF